MGVRPDQVTDRCDISDHRSSWPMVVDGLTYAGERIFMRPATCGRRPSDPGRGNRCCRACGGGAMQRILQVNFRAFMFHAPR
jgi:hypothetical protein